jgi:phosphopantothenoylcysteine decarboxylase/phosphopantothenate--cysteine ligase
MSLLKGKKILLGVSGSIAAYKALELTRLLLKEGSEVRVVMTENAQKFITPLSFETLSGNKVTTTLFPIEGAGTLHLELAGWGDIVVVAPATANLIGKYANGIADDPLSTVLHSVNVPVMFAPAMHPSLWENPKTRENERKLRGMGVYFIGPVFGKLSGTDEGMGRMVDPSEIMLKAKEILARGRDLEGKKILITTGATEEELDTVRVITNPSSGKMGISLAEAAKMRGAEVSLIHGRTEIQVPTVDEIIYARSGEKMKKAVLDRLLKIHLLIMVAAVSDYKASHRSPQKIKEKGKFSLELERVPDILTEVKSKLSSSSIKPVIIGFSVESENGVDRAKRKLEEKGLDLIVANRPATFGSDEIEAVLIRNNGKEKALPKYTKREAAEEILDQAVEILKNR